MSNKATNYIPSGSNTITPHLVLKDVAKAIDFYKKVFGAEELSRLLGPNGKIMHACLKFGDSSVFFSDEFPERGNFGPDPSKGAHVTIHIYVPNVDEIYKRAVDAGAKAEMPPADMFWGDRYGRLTDPFGQTWSIATHIEDMTPEEMTQRGAECMKEPAAAK